jgi:hypothetical protein
MKIFNNIELQATGSLPAGSFRTTAVPAGFVRLFVQNNALYAHTSDGNYIRLHGS